MGIKDEAIPEDRFKEAGDIEPTIDADVPPDSMEMGQTLNDRGLERTLPEDVTLDANVPPDSMGATLEYSGPPPEVSPRTETTRIDTPMGEFGDYELIEKIAQGGMGVVYKARQKKADRVVALKMILSGQFADKREVMRFHTEAQSAAQLDHPNIVPVYDVGEIDGQHYFSMGFVEGSSLDALVVEHPLEPKQAVEIVKTCAEAVAYAHGKQIIHRDLKPANILLDKEGRPKLTDFGLAKRIEDASGVTMSGQVLGTPSYMPPEQARGNTDVGPQADVYSLGAVLYQLLTGKPPFRAASVWQTIAQVIEQDPAPPMQLNQEIDLDLDTIILKALEKDRSKRYESATALADDLQAYLENRPISARRITRAERVVRWAKRNRLVATLLVVLAVGVVATVIASVGAAVVFYDMAVTQTDLREKADGAYIAKNENLYVAEMNLAMEAVDQQGGLGRVQHLVQKWHPAKAGEPDLRGWEWYLLHDLGYPERSATPRIDLAWPVMCIAESEPGLLATGHAAELILIDLQSFDVAARWQAHEFPIQSVSFSRDGMRLATSSADRMAKVWDVRTKKLLFEFQHEEHVGDAVLSPDGKLMASHGHDDRGTVRIFDIDGKTVQTVIGDRVDGETAQMAFSPNGRYLAVGGFMLVDDYPVVIWDVVEERIVKTLHGMTRKVLSICWSPDSRRVAAGGYNKVVYVWDASSGAVIHELSKHARTVRAVAWSSNGRWLASGGDDFSVRVWDPVLGKQVRVYNGHNDAITDLDWSPVDPILNSSSMDNTIRSWDVEKPRAINSVAVAKVHIDASANGALQWKPDGSRVAATISKSRVWNETLTREDRNAAGRARLCWSADGRHAAWMNDLTLFVSNGDLTGETKTFRPKDIYHFFARVAWSPVDGDQRVALMDNAKLWVWDVDRESEARHIASVSGTAASAMVWSPDGKSVFVGGFDGKVRQFDSTSGETIREFSALERKVVNAIAPHPTKPLLATNGNGYTVRIWNTQTWKMEKELPGHTFNIWSLDWRPDGSRLASACGDGSIRVWDIDRVDADRADVDGATMLSLEHGDEVRVVRWSPDGKRIASLTVDGMLRVFDATKAYQFEGKYHWLVQDEQ